jgi:hypothetical protein
MSSKPYHLLFEDLRIVWFFLAMYVDDLFLFNKDLKTIKRSFLQKFEMKDLREFEFFLGI